MPIEVKELIIRTQVHDQPRENANQALDVEALKREVLEETRKTIEQEFKRKFQS